MTAGVACLDMAGTTVSDGGVVMAAFTTALDAAGLASDDPVRARVMDTVAATMGQSKIEVFTRIFGDRETAQRANDAFESAYDDAVQRGEVNAIPGAEQAIAALQAGGFKVCLTTGFSPRTRDRILTALDWHDAVDLALSPADAGRGRPWPDLIWSAALRLGANRARDIVVAGDTASDIESGRRAAAGLIVGVCTGAGSPGELRAAGADEVVEDITVLPALLRLGSPDREVS